MIAIPTSVSSGKECPLPETRRVQMDPALWTGAPAPTRPQSLECLRHRAGRGRLRLVLTGSRVYISFEWPPIDSQLEY